MGDTPRGPSGRFGSEVDRPWLQRRDGETAREFRSRLNHTCYSCGVFMVDMDALDAHEETHK